jgi:hypothetical protein
LGIGGQEKREKRELKIIIFMIFYGPSQFNLPTSSLYHQTIFLPFLPSLTPTSYTNSRASRSSAATSTLSNDISLTSITSSARPTPP